MPNSAHSIFIWQDGAEAYAVIVDNTEFSDVDIFNITDPKNPEFILDLDLLELAIDQDVSRSSRTRSALGGNIFLHDMVVKQINGQPIMLASYWDSGYIKVNVSDPENPVIIGDSSFGERGPDDGRCRAPTRAGRRPRATATKAEFSHDNKFVLAADEDFNAYRLLGQVDQGGGDIFRFFAGWRADPGPADHDRPGHRGRHALRRRRAASRPTIPLATPGVNIAVDRARQLRLPGQGRERRGARLQQRDHLQHPTGCRQPPARASST